MSERKLIEDGALPLLPPLKALPPPVSPQERLAGVVAEVGVTGTLNMLVAIEKTEA